MGTHPIFESDFDCLTENHLKKKLEINNNGSQSKEIVNGQ